MAPIEKASVKIGILSIGEMGFGVARLLVAHGFSVVTNCQGRSEDTALRAQKAGVETVTSDLGLVQECALILSVVPPRDAEATAQRIIDAMSGGAHKERLYFADLNAVSPSTCKAIATLFDKSRVPVNFIDGCILGGPPRPKTAPDPGTNVSSSKPDDNEWDRPSIPVSGPHSFSSLPDGERLTSVLNSRVISADIGAASGLKMCFAAFSKGFTALATQSFTTAHRLGVVDDLKREMGDILPNHLSMAQRGVPGMPPKAYRWVREMEEISRTMSEEGGWGRELFQGAAGVYKAVAENDVLGKEKTGKRTRGTSVDDVAAALTEGFEKKRKKME